MLYLLLRLPGAAAHALEQKQLGFKRFPFFHGAVKYTGPGADND
jgi:citrate synthase